MKQLEIFPTIKEGVSIALVNYLSVLCAVLLYVVTIWIPYLNVGTTIAMASLPAEMAKGNVIDPTFIFDSKFRRNLGEFFILVSLMSGAIGMGFLCGIIPGIVIGYAWYLAVILFVDKDMKALDSLHESNKLTYGNKARIFGIEILLAVFFGVAFALVGYLFSLSENTWMLVLGGCVIFLLVLFIIPALFGVQAVIYKSLTAPIIDAETPVDK